MLELLKDAFPHVLFPSSYQASRSLERGLGFSYTKTEAFPNNHVLYWKENANLEACLTCGTSRWNPKASKKKKMPTKYCATFH